MPPPWSVAACTLPTFNGTCFKLSGAKTYYVTSQPLSSTVDPYAAIAQAGISSVLSVRDAAETTATPPFDITETDKLILAGVAYANIPLPHIAMSQTMFDEQAYHVASFLNASLGPTLIHCSTGDRASAGFGAYLVTYGGVPAVAAVLFAQRLALKNTQFIQWLAAYQPKQS